MVILGVAVLGMLGVLSRFFIDRVAAGWGYEFPAATFAINCFGSFLIGIAVVAANEAGALSKETSLMVTVGFLGGFTTFSAFSLQTFQLFEKGQTALAAGYFIGSPAAGLACIAAGIYLGRAVL